MKRDDLIKYHQWSVKELEQEMLKKQRKLAELRLAINSGKQKNTNAIKINRQDLARIKTIIKEREMGVLFEKKINVAGQKEQSIKKEEKPVKKAAKEAVKAKN